MLTDIEIAADIFKSGFSVKRLLRSP